jgi:uncharacterized OsmC-like protein
MDNELKDFSIALDSVQDYEFRVKFDALLRQDFLIDEPEPVGHDKGPDPSKLLAAAVGGCLSISLLFCAKKSRLNSLQSIHSEVKVQHTRNEKGRLRIGKIKVEITPKFESADEQKFKRCLELFEDFCVVTQSVRNGIDVSVNVKQDGIGS